MIEKYGAEMVRFNVRGNTNIKKGVVKRRRCTNFISFVTIYTVFIFSLISLMIYVFDQQHVAEWITSIDFNGNSCGYEGNTGYPYLYYLK